MQKRGQWKAFSSVTRHDKSSLLATDYQSLLRNKLITIAQRAEVLWTKQLQVRRLTNAWLGEHTIGVFGGNGFLTKATNLLGLRGYVLGTKFGPRYDVTQAIVLSRIRQDVSAGNVSQEGFHLHLHDTTLRAFTKLFPPMLPSPTCFIVLARLGFWNTHVIRGCGMCKNRSFCGATSHGLGPGGLLSSRFAVQRANIFGSEPRRVLLAGALGQADVPV